MLCLVVVFICHGSLTRYVKLRIAHVPGMPGTFSPPPRVSDPDIHHGTCVTHVPWWMLGSITSGFLLNRFWGKRSRHSRRMRNPQFYISGKRPIPVVSRDLFIYVLQCWFTSNGATVRSPQCQRSNLKGNVMSTDSKPRPNTKRSHRVHISWDQLLYHNIVWATWHQEGWAEFIVSSSQICKVFSFTPLS